MFQQSYRGTLVWLVIIGAALTLALIAGELSTEASAGLLALYMVLSVAVLRGLSMPSVADVLPVRRSQEPESTETAREAMARARGFPQYDALIRLLDVGLLVDEQRPDGLSLRRGRFVSLDDDGLRPFAIVHVPDALGNRIARLRFEIRDDSGELHYVFEDEKWLQAGENPLLPDYRFPVRRNTKQLAPGSWSVRVEIDGGLLGVHHFNLAASLQQRRQMAADGELHERVWRSQDEDESLPLSLEELLRQQSRERRQSG